MLKEFHVRHDESNACLLALRELLKLNNHNHLLFNEGVEKGKIYSTLSKDALSKKIYEKFQVTGWEPEGVLKEGDKCQKSLISAVIYRGLFFALSAEPNLIYALEALLKHIVAKVNSQLPKYILAIQNISLIAEECLTGFSSLKNKNPQLSLPDLFQIIFNDVKKTTGKSMRGNSFSDKDFFLDFDLKGRKKFHKKRDDSLGELVDSCVRNDFRSTCYFLAGRSHTEELIKRREASASHKKQSKLIVLQQRRESDHRERGVQPR